MILRSPWQGSHISNLEAISLDRFAELHRIAPVSNIPLADFVRYGLWVQAQAAEPVDRRSVECVDKTADGFELLLEDGERISAKKVVIAAGILPFAYRPKAFASLPPLLASHSSDHDRLDHFAGREVLVIGGGQSALESTALLREAGASVKVIVRGSQIHWLGRGRRMVRRLGPLQHLAEKVLYPPADVGPPGMNWMISTPLAYRQLPNRLQLRIAQRALRPAGSSWLRPRVDGVSIEVDKEVISAGTCGHKACIRLNDGTETFVDHVLLATGFRIDLARYRFLSPKLIRQICLVDGYPRLTRKFESSLPGLYILGAPAAKSFSPLTRFVAGSGFAATSLARGITGNGHGPLRD